MDLARAVNYHARGSLVPSSNDTMDDNKTEEYITSKVLAVFLD
jgi:hypothetical protein